MKLYALVLVALFPIASEACLHMSSQVDPRLRQFVSMSRKLSATTKSRLLKFFAAQTEKTSTLGSKNMASTPCPTNYKNPTCAKVLTF
jgi:hypothetical protein